MPIEFANYASATPLVCKLIKSLYGLRQSSRKWFIKFKSVLIPYGFIQASSDHSLFILSTSAKFLDVLVYVDNILVLGNNQPTITAFKAHLASHFKIKDLRAIKYFLGIKAARSDNDIYLNQRKYTLDIIQDAGLANAKFAIVPIEQNHTLLSNVLSQFLFNPAPYRQLVGSLIYLTITRPDLAYAVHVLSQFLASPRQCHLDAAHCVMRYLKYIVGQDILLFASTDLKLTAYADADCDRVS